MMPNGVIESLMVAGIIGVIGMLWRISAQLACIKVELRQYGATSKDHEQRIRKLENDR